MNVWVALVGGIILGWLIEWVIDWYYWRRGAEAFYLMERDLRAELAVTRQELADAQATIDHLHEQTGLDSSTGVPAGAAKTGAESRPSGPR